ncbi:MAG: RagB/SusD family nutrient uptake outer membrane protein [Gemmatimonadetes bacterium]|nr:RagB/SusD family nutrient uptake outer membrane protein [Gemmatimonadota bacterium]
MTKIIRIVPVLGVALLPLACDFDVVNPGPVQEAFLDDPSSQPALVAGAGRATAQALNYLAYTSAAIAREIHPAGSTGSFGIDQRWQDGELPDDVDNTHWNWSQRARWLAEKAVDVIEEQGGESQPGLLAQAYLWVGYANRMNGEHMCQAVIDGAAPTSNNEYLNRAEAAFSQASTLGSGAVKDAAIAGRASVRAQLGKWAEAAADAAQISDGFSYMMPYYDGFGDDLRNRIYWATGKTPYKAHSQWNTWIEGYGLNPTTNPNGDPRVAYRDGGETGDAAVQGCLPFCPTSPGRVPWYPTTKYTSSGDDIELSSGPEMRLIEAEKMLMDGDWQGAMDKVNALRTAAGMSAETATNLAEAWGFFKREHAIEMWLEGRRLPALRRWKDAGLTEDDLQPLEKVSGSRDLGSHLVTRDYCFPIALSEQQTNTNVGTGG